MPSLRAVIAALTVSLALSSLAAAPSSAAAPASSPSRAPGAATRAAAVTADASVAGGLHALPAHRILDTRTGLGAPKAAVAAGSTVTLQVTGREGVPSTGVGAVALTVTAVSPTAAGNVTAYAAGASVPTATALSYGTGDLAANLAVTRVSSDGRVSLRVGGSGSTQLLAEVVGWYAAGAATEPGATTVLQPSRLLDTRSGLGAPAGAVVGGRTVSLTVAGRGGVPSTGAGSVLLDVTVTGSTAAGTITAGATLPATVTTSNLSFVAGQTRTNLVTVPLSDTGTVDLRVTSAGSVHVLADVVGWVRAGAPASEGTSAAMAPARAYDTHVDEDGPLENLSHAMFTPVGRGQVPTTGVHAVWLNVRSTAATAQGRASLLPLNGRNLPTGSQVQFTKGRDDQNLVLAPVSPDGAVDLVVQGSGTVHLVIDVVGWVTGPTVDVYAPPAVTGLTSTMLDRTSLRLSWTNPVDADFTGVTVRRYPGGSSIDPLTGTLLAETTGTTFTDTNLEPGATYRYGVFAHDAFPNLVSNTVTVTVPAPTWHTPTRVAPVVGSPQQVSCLSASWCMSLDASGQYQLWSGTAWSAPKRAVLVGDVDDDQLISELSCGSTSLCAAGVGRGGIALYRGGVWGAVTYPKLSNGSVVQNWRVDCVGSTFCMAVGQDLTGASWGMRWTGTAWTTAGRVSGWLRNIDCVSTTFCMAVGPDRSGYGYASRFNGSTWFTARIDATTVGIQDVSCSSTTFCMATGESGRYIRFVGSSWTAPARATTPFFGQFASCTSSTFCVVYDPMYGMSRWSGTSWGAFKRLSYPDSNNALSCAASTCMAVDAAGRYARYNGSTWTSMAGFSATRGQMASLTCPTTTSCTAADNRGEVYRFNGTSWSAPVSLSWSRGLVSCATATWCVYLAPDQNQYRLLNGTSWSGLAAAPAFVWSLRCPAVGWCVAVDQSGRWSTFNGTSWTTPKALFSAGGGAEVDCTSRTFCMAVNLTDNRWSRWNGSAWTTPAAVSTTSSDGGVVACASTSMCISADWYGRSYQFTGSSWKVLSNSPSNAASIDCPTTTLCRVLSSAGRVAVWRSGAWVLEEQSTGLYMEDGRPADAPAAIACPDTYSCVVIGRSKVARLS